MKLFSFSDKKMAVRKRLNFTEALYTMIRSEIQTATGKLILNSAIDCKQKNKIKFKFKKNVSILEPWILK